MNVFNPGTSYHRILLFLCLFLAACAPPNPDELLKKAQLHLAAGETSAAIIELKNVLQVEPRNADARLQLGEIYFAMGDMPLALRELEGAADSGIAKERVQKMLLDAKNRQGRFREVIGELEAQTEKDAEHEVILGEAYLAAKDHPKARVHFDKALKQAAQNGRAAVGLALSSVAEGNVFAATGHYSDAVMWSPDDQRIWIHKGNFELASQNFELALESFTHALDLKGPKYVANLGITRSYIALGRLPDAELAINKVLEETKKVPVAYFIKAQILFQQQEFERAENVLDRGLKIAPNNPAALYLKAAIYFQLERYGLAENLLRALLKAQPENLQVRLLMATAQFRQGDAKTALDTLEPRVDQIESSEGLALLGSLYLQNNQAARAIKSLSAALALNPGNHQIRTQLALGHLADGNTSIAVEELQRAVAGGGELMQDDALLVLVKMREGDFDAALLEAQKFQMRHPESVVAHNLLGSVYLALSNTDAAKAAFERATKLDTAFSPAVFNLAKMASNSGDKKAARTLFKNFLTANPDSIEAYIALGQLELEAGDLEAATGNFQKAADLDLSVNGEQKVANIPFELGRVELSHKNMDLARSYFKQALEISSGTHKQALLALIQVERASGNKGQLEQLFVQLENLMPDSVIYYMLLAEYQLENNQSASAQVNFKKAAELKHRGATLRYASFMESNGEIAEAITVLEQWVAANSADLAATAMLGGYYLIEESADKAAKIYESLDLRSPNNAAVLNNLAWAYYLGKDDRAEAVARRAYELSPDNAHMADTLGWILVQNNKFSDALDIFDRALRFDPDNASIYYHAAVAYSRANRLGDARDSLEKALALGEFPERAAAESLVNNLNI